MNCKFCNAQLEEEQKFCPVCGANQEEPEAIPAVQEPEAVEEAVAAPEVMAEEVTDTPDEVKKAIEALEEMGAAPEETEDQPEEQPEAVNDYSALYANTVMPVQSSSANPVKIVIAFVCGVLLTAVVVLAVLFGTGVIKWGGEETQPATTDATADTTEATKAVFNGKSYSVDDETAKAHSADVIATVGNAQLDNAQLQIHYWMEVLNFLNEYSYYLSYIGMDYTQPLSQQVCYFDQQISWEEYFLEMALGSWHRYAGLTQQAEAEGYVYDEAAQAYLDGLPQQAASMVAGSNYATLEELLQAEMGPACTESAYLEYMAISYKGLTFFESKYDSLIPTEDELEAYYNEHLADFEEGGTTKEAGNYVDVRHILISVEGGTTAEDGTTTHTDEEWATALAKAEKVYEEWKNGEATEDSFAASANANSTDPGSNTNGGLYTQVKPGQMVPEFNDWCFDEARQVGDHGIVKTDYGYHIMYFVGAEPVWKITAKDALLNERTAALIDGATETFAMDVDYDKIVLGQVDLG